MDYLYHASATQGLTKIEPRKRSTRSAKDPARVYAAPSKQIAAPFIGHGFDFGSWNNGPWTLVIDEETRDLLDHASGSIYTVSRDGFTYDPNVGLKSAEWFSSEPTPVLAEERWNSALQAARAYALRICVLVGNTQTEFRELTSDVQARVLRNAVPRSDGTMQLSFSRLSVF